MILIAIGANLPDRRGAHPLVSCKSAVEALRDLPGLRVTAVSRWYLTDPVPASTQPSYVNGAIRLEGEADPAWLLHRLLAIEARAGRVRDTPPNTRHDARVLDLDLIAVGGLIRDAPDPVLPHPRAHERGFVLAPLAEIAADWVHPRTGRNPVDMLGALSPQGRSLL